MYFTSLPGAAIHQCHYHMQVGVMMKYVHEHGLWPPGTDLKSGQRAAGHPLTTWEQWLRKTGWRG